MSVLGLAGGGLASVQVRGELVLVGLDLGHADRAQVVTCRP
jgi:hypothetical protein